MKKPIILLLNCLFTFALFAQNWDFEEWDDGQPTGWITAVNTTQDTVNLTESCCRFEPFLDGTAHRPMLKGTFIVDFNELPKFFSFNFKAALTKINLTRFFFYYSIKITYPIVNSDHNCSSYLTDHVFFKLYYVPKKWKQIVVPIPTPTCAHEVYTDSIISLKNVVVQIAFDLQQDHAFAKEALGLAWLDAITFSPVNPQNMFSNLEYKDVLISGETETIKWDGGPNTENLILSYTTDDGESFQRIGTASPGSVGQLDWDIPVGLLADKCRLRLTIESTGEDMNTSNIFYIKPYVLTRLEINDEMTEYNSLTDSWGFENDSADVWPEWYYNQFDYNGIDPFTNLPFDTIQAPVFKDAKPSDFVPWEAFVRAFTTDACYFNLHSGIYSPLALANWESKKGDWGGSCFAIAGSNALAFSEKQSFRNSYSTFPEFDTPLSLRSSADVIDNLSQIFAHQYGDPTFQNRMNVPVWSQITPKQVVDELKTHFRIANVTPRTISFWHNHDSGGHTIVPYQLRNDTINENIYYIDVYDNEYPDELDANITVNLADNGGDGSWDYSLWPGWGGSSKLKLECDSRVYLSMPILKNASRSAFILTGDSIQIGCNPFEDIRIKNSQGKSTGFYDNKLKSEIEGCSPLINCSGRLEKPYAYYMPNGNYSVTLDNFNSDLASAFFFYSNKALVYKRILTEESQTDKLTFGNGITMVNPDEEIKEAQLDLIIKETDREKVFRLYPLPIGPGDSIRLESPDDNQVVLYNYGSTKTYGVELNSFSGNGFERFVKESIPVKANTSHIFNINWTDVEESVLTIYVDEEMNGADEDTLRFNQEVTGFLEILNSGLLVNVWPNPTRDKLTFSYTLDKASKVSLNIFYTDGKQVLSKMNQFLQARGKQIVFVELSGLPAGIYYYRITINSQTDYGKIIKI